MRRAAFPLTLQNSFPLRLRGVHFIHGSFVVNAILPLLNPFSAEKIADKVSLYLLICSELP